MTRTLRFTCPDDIRSVIKQQPVKKGEHIEIEIAPLLPLSEASIVDTCRTSRPQLELDLLPLGEAWHRQWIRFFQCFQGVLRSVEFDTTLPTRVLHQGVEKSVRWHTDPKLTSRDLEETAVLVSHDSFKHLAMYLAFEARDMMNGIPTTFKLLHERPAAWPRKLPMHLEGFIEALDLLSGPMWQVVERKYKDKQEAFHARLRRQIQNYREEGKLLGCEICIAPDSPGLLSQDHPH